MILMVNPTYNSFCALSERHYKETELEVIKKSVREDGTEIVVYQFQNGFGASVIRGAYSFGGNEGYWELCEIFKIGDKWTFKSDNLSAPVGWLNWEQVENIIDTIRKRKK